MDWNWFFSSIAQSVAALVGIFSAFLITKIVTNQAEFGKKNTRAQEMLSSSTRLCDALSQRHFNWYNRLTLNNDLKILRITLQHQKKEVSTPEQYYESYVSSPFIPRQEVLRAIQNVIDSDKAQKSRPPKNPLDYFSASIPGEEAREQALSRRLERERELIDPLITDVKHNIREVGLFLQEVEGNPESSALVGWSILGAIVLFFCGIVIPLSFLPCVSNSATALPNNISSESLSWVKSINLSVISLIFTAILIVFGGINRSLKYKPALLDQLQPFTVIETYSRFLSIMEVNVQQQTAWHNNSE